MLFWMFYIHTLYIQEFSEMGFTQNEGGDLNWGWGGGGGDGSVNN